MYTFIVSYNLFGTITVSHQHHLLSWTTTFNEAQVSRVWSTYSAARDIINLNYVRKRNLLVTITYSPDRIPFQIIHNQPVKPFEQQYWVHGYHSKVRKQLKINVTVPTYRVAFSMEIKRKLHDESINFITAQLNGNHDDQIVTSDYGNSVELSYSRHTRT